MGKSSELYWGRNQLSCNEGLSLPEFADSQLPRGKVNASKAQLYGVRFLQRELQIHVAWTRHGSGDANCENKLSPSLRDGHLPFSKVIRAEVRSPMARRDEIQH